MSNDLDMGSYSHASVDVETLSLRQDAVILSIGATVFDPFKVQQPLDIAEGAAFHLHVNVQDQIKKGYRFDSETMAWWNKQTPEARKEVNLMGDYEDFLHHDALMRFAAWLVNNNITALWADPSQFDLGLLSFHTQKAGVKLRVKHSDMLDGSTLCSLRGIRYRRLESSVGFPHQAYYDAVNQAAEIQRNLGAIAAFGVKGHPYNEAE